MSLMTLSLSLSLSLPMHLPAATGLLLLLLLLLLSFHGLTTLEIRLVNLVFPIRAGHGFCGGSHPDVPA